MCGRNIRKMCPVLYISIYIINSECEPGYFWINCTKICPYPTFGKSCAQTCSCTNTSCDFANGCKNGKQIQMLFFGIFNVCSIYIVRHIFCISDTLCLFVWWIGFHKVGRRGETREMQTKGNINNSLKKTLVEGDRATGIKAIYRT